MLFEETNLSHSTEHSRILQNQVASKPVQDEKKVEGKLIYLGSGTTAIAAKNTKRNFKGTEISKEYYDKIIKLIK